MNIEELRYFCLSLSGTEEKTPFNDKTLVFYVMGKVFCLTNMVNYDFINLKCNPEKAIEIREAHTEVTPAYHMNKKHWNSIGIQGNISDELLKQWIIESYALVIKGLPKKTQNELNNKP